jgi:hypothetical protein
VIEHIKGKENKVADALSRRPDYRDPESNHQKTELLIEENGRLKLNRNMKMNMVTTLREDQELINEIKEEMRDNQGRPELQTDENGYKRFKGMIFVPKNKEREVMKRYHDDIREGHPGIARTMEKIQRTFYFPGMYRKIKKYISQCDSCERNKNEYRKPQGKMTVDKEVPGEPWKRLTADFMEMPATTNIAGTEEYDELLVVVDTFSKQTVHTNAENGDY